MQPQQTAPEQAFSVLIISSGRDAHLANAVRGISRSTRRPAEIVVCYLNQPEAVPPPSDVPLRVVHAASGAGEPLPLGAGRNAAAAAARSETLVFLDVDCIPATGMFGHLLSDLDRNRGLVMAAPRYLTADADVPGWVSDGDDQVLYRDSVPHHARAALAPAPGEPARASQEYALFWSLGFAVHRGTFEPIGGFDESFAGYGGEDTDFAFTAQRKAVPLAFSGATMFHQHHGVHRPPLQHLESIVINAKAFRGKWGSWPMTGWLEAFARDGYVSWERDGGDLRLLRRPGPAELAAARVNAPY
ncbi:glycosyltransferase family 2 protein [Arthrobacter sp. zg-Y1171]|uniref:glycosyltransferase family 2 protein n=1 Tax=Arthrobacter sp. zg-Y1171 TaxID=2964610 RepID=UPI0021064EA7|nr:galactosyltransferase-related protein [Arthrobacter sp. zg-Y1171]MCQ1995603.1 galactosyltransferase-related protein [Arthrobacter sp. zg-Y1171]UWX83305.1 galactosyltransferase-related protein [Arthrobacter sp. zg-Y1171]